MESKPSGCCDCTPHGCCWRAVCATAAFSLALAAYAALVVAVPAAGEPALRAVHWLLRVTKLGDAVYGDCWEGQCPQAYHPFSTPEDVLAGCLAPGAKQGCR